MPGYHPPEITCAGVRRGGRPCKRPPMRGERFCKDHLHVEQAPLGTDVAIAAMVAAHGNTPRTRDTLEVVDPLTGEIHVLGDADNNTLHGLLQALVIHQEQVEEARKMVDREVTKRMDAAARWTIDTDHGRMQAPSSAPVLAIEDAPGLRNALLELGLAEAVVDGAVKMEVKVTYKVVQRGLNALSKVPEPAAVIKRFVKYVPRASHRRVELKRRGS